jgi:flagellar basal body-associated protein FliL
MADENEVQKQDSEQEKTDEKTPSEKTPGPPFLKWIIMAVVAILCAGTGFALSQLFVGSPAPATADSLQQHETNQAEELTPDDSTTNPREVWYYDLEPVVANLDVPGVTRYVRAALTLAMDSGVEQKKGVALLDEKKPILTNWLTIYLASLSLEDIRGDKNLRRIQSQILDAFNEKLFPDAKPQIKHIFFKEFAVQ